MDLGYRIDGHRMDIAMGFDANYAPHAATTIASVVRHAPGAQFRFLLLHADIPPDIQARVGRAAPGHDFVWIEVKNEDMPNYVRNEQLSYINRSTLFRLGLETLAPEDAQQVLYLDADLVVLSDVRELFEIGINSQPLAAVDDVYVNSGEFAQRWKLPPDGRYFNAGVLLLDLDEVRRAKLLTKAMCFLTEHGPDLPFADQDALNWAFWKHWHRIDPSWNVQRNSALSGTLPGDGAPAIVHFTTSEKPWVANIWHPWSWVYWDNLGRTPFLNEVSHKQGVSFWGRQRLRLRWIKRRPPTRKQRPYTL